MSTLFACFQEPSKYWDKKSFQTQEEYNECIQTSSTVYVGNLSIQTTQFSIFELFSKIGKVEKIIMGINKEGQSAGFAFVIYNTNKNAMLSVQCINSLKLDDRTIRVDVDAGFVEGRQYGRGFGQNQVRDQMRSEFDPERHNTHKDFQNNRRRDNSRNYRPEWDTRGKKNWDNNYRDNYKKRY